MGRRAGGSSDPTFVACAIVLAVAIIVTIAGETWLHWPAALLALAMFRVVVSATNRRRR